MPHSELAPAKINLALHVLGRKGDGYHELDSIVAFADIADRLTFAEAPDWRLHITGPFARALPLGDDNLVLKAARAFAAAYPGQGGTYRITLEKNLPVASGIGGGSADAAATLRGLLRLWDAQISEPELSALALSLGADVPMCLKSRPLAARGIGEDITMLDTMPSFAIVLANPLRGVSTPDIFRRLTTKNNPAIPALTGDWQADLSALRNDLEPPARSLVSEIGELSELIAAEGAWLARMSGSGATYFGLFETSAKAVNAANSLQSKRPDWYFTAARTIGAK